MPGGRHQDYFRFSILDSRLFRVQCSVFQILYGSKNWLRFHHHPLPSAEWRIIDHVMFVRCPIAQVVNVQFDNSVLLRPFHDAFAQRSAADFRKQRDNVDSHLGKTSNAERQTSNAETVGRFFENVAASETAAL